MSEKRLILGAGKKPKQIEGSSPQPAPVEARAQAPAPAPKGNTPVAVQQFTLKGVTHSKYPFDTLVVGQQVHLVPDPYGKTVDRGGHDDPGAISVQDSANCHIGYIDKMAAQVVSKAISSGKFNNYTIVADIKGGYKGAKGEKLNWGVDILAKFYKIDE